MSLSHFSTFDKEKEGGRHDAAIYYSYDAYDPANGQYGKTRRTGMSDSSGSTAWKYDGRGRVIQEVKVISGSGTFKSEWLYNSADLVDWMKYPADTNGNLGEAVVYSYHPQMLVNNVWGTNTYVQSSSYDAAGRLVQLVRGVGTLTTNYTYYGWTETASLDGQQVGQGARLKQVATGTLQDLRYLYDAVGNVRKIEDYKLGNPQKQNFTYDSLTGFPDRGGPTR